MGEAKQLFEKYKKQEPMQDKTEQQFCIVMNTEIMKQQGADRAELGRRYEAAVGLTVPQTERIYQEDAPVYMESCTYLYRQRWVFAIGDALRIRRNMLGLTQEQVCEGICSVKSLRRAEKKQANMQRGSLRKILMRLGLSKEIQKTALVTNDRSVLNLNNDLNNCRNNREPEKARMLLGRIKNKLCLEIPENMQFVMVSVTNELSSLGEYQLAAALDKKGLREVLRCRRLYMVNAFLYDLWWIDKEQKSKEKQQEEMKKMTEDLNKCIMLSHFYKETFYEKCYWKVMHQLVVVS